MLTGVNTVVVALDVAAKVFLVVTAIDNQCIGLVLILENLQSNI